VAVHRDGSIWCGTETGDLLRLAADGDSVERIGGTGGFLIGIAFDSAGNCFACDLRHAAIFRWDAGWHTSKRLTLPDNITLVPLPAKCPELNPQENVWEFMRDNWLSNRIFTSYENIVDHCCHACNKLAIRTLRRNGQNICRMMSAFENPVRRSDARLMGPAQTGETDDACDGDGEGDR
jgi:DDE superfamily endonuclease